MEMNWSRWFRCESSFGLLLVPNQPGIFALAEEVAQPAGPYSRRMLAVFAVEEADDLARATSRLFALGSPLRERLVQANCFIRYAVAPGIADRRTAATALKNWLHSQREVASHIFEQKPFEQRLAMATEKSVPLAIATVTNMDRNEHPAEYEAPALMGVTETTELKTIAERAVDRVTRGMKLSKAVTAGY